MSWVTGFVAIQFQNQGGQIGGIHTEREPPNKTSWICILASCWTSHVALVSGSECQHGDLQAKVGRMANSHPELSRELLQFHPFTHTFNLASEASLPSSLAFLCVHSCSEDASDQRMNPKGAPSACPVAASGGRKNPPSLLFRDLL